MHLRVWRGGDPTSNAIAARQNAVADAGGDWGLFGLHAVPADATELVITEGEYDAMAVYQATGRAAVSLPNGAASLPPVCPVCSTGITQSLKTFHKRL